MPLRPGSSRLAPGAAEPRVWAVVRRAARGDAG